MESILAGAVISPAEGDLKWDAGKGSCRQGPHPHKAPTHKKAPTHTRLHLAGI